MRRVATAVVLDVVGSAAVLVLLSLTWQRVRVDRDPPFADVAVGLSGRDVSPVVFGLALVALAGAVAALATKGLARRLVGVVVTLAGLAALVIPLLSLGGASHARARDLAAAAVADRTSAATIVPIGDGTVSVAVQAVWPVLTAVGGLLVVVAGVVFLLPAAAGGAGGTGGGLGPRYDAPVAAERPRDATLWSALDHGEDPTVDPTADPSDATPTRAVPDPDTPLDPAANRPADTL